MKRYETLFIVQVDLPTDELNSLIERYKTIVTAFKGTIIRVEKWGKRKLAYEIKKQSNGLYVLLDFAGKSSIIEELERNFKIDDKVLKFMTIMKDANIDLATIEREKQDDSQGESERTTPAIEGRESGAPKTEADTHKESTAPESA